MKLGKLVKCQTNITFNFEANVPFIDFALATVAFLQWNEFYETEQDVGQKRKKELEIASQTSKMKVVAAFGVHCCYMTFT